MEIKTTAHRKTITIHNSFTDNFVTKRLVPLFIRRSSTPKRGTGATKGTDLLNYWYINITQLNSDYNLLIKWKGRSGVL